MDIIQLKLIWLIASLAALLLLFKLELNRLGVKKSVLRRLRLGASLIFAGAFLGIVLKAGFNTSSFARSDSAFLLEAIVGYTFGWSFILWGFMAWAKSYFDLRGKPLSTAGSGLISGKVMSSLVAGHSSAMLINSVQDDLLGLLDSSAVSLHSASDGGGLRLIYHHNLSEDSAKLIEKPRGHNNLFLTAQDTRQAVINDKDHSIHDFAFIETSDSPVKAAVGVPVRSNGETLGVIGLYRTSDKLYTQDNIDIIAIVCSALGAAIKRESAEKKQHLENRYTEMLAMAAKAFETDPDLVSALVKSAKQIHSYIPFRWINMYIHGEGKIQSLDFHLPAGGTVEIKQGYFSQEKFPELYSGKSVGMSRGKSARSENDNRTFRFPVTQGKRLVANLELELQSSPVKSTYVEILGSTLVPKIALALGRTSMESLRERTEHWLGALQYFQEKVLSSKNITPVLMELASLAVDLAPTTFCRIMFTDKDRKSLKTAALAQARDLAWSVRPDTEISLSEEFHHYRALQTGMVITYDQNNKYKRIPQPESNCLIPTDTRQGIIIPLSINGAVVGLLSAGDFRSAERTMDNSVNHIFLKAMAALISMMLARHRDSKQQKTVKEGARKLTILAKGTARENRRPDPSLNINSRINGPLAGILASCEYLTSGLPKHDEEIQRYLGIIHKNASRIHNITMGTNSEEVSVIS